MFWVFDWLISRTIFPKNDTQPKITTFTFLFSSKRFTTPTQIGTEPNSPIQEQSTPRFIFSLAYSFYLTSVFIIPTFCHTILGFVLLSSFNKCFYLSTLERRSNQLLLVIGLNTELIIKIISHSFSVDRLNVNTAKRLSSRAECLSAPVCRGVAMRGPV